MCGTVNCATQSSLECLATIYTFVRAGCLDLGHVLMLCGCTTVRLTAGQVRELKAAGHTIIIHTDRALAGGGSGLAQVG